MSVFDVEKIWHSPNVIFGNDVYKHRNKRLSWDSFNSACKKVIYSINQ